MSRLALSVILVLGLVGAGFLWVERGSDPALGRGDRPRSLSRSETLSPGAGADRGVRSRKPVGDPVRPPSTTEEPEFVFRPNEPARVRAEMTNIVRGMENAAREAAGSLGPMDHMVAEAELAEQRYLRRAVERYCSSDEAPGLEFEWRSSGALPKVPAGTIWVVQTRFRLDPNKPPLDLVVRIRDAEGQVLISNTHKAKEVRRWEEASRFNALPLTERQALIAQRLSIRNGKSRIGDAPPVLRRLINLGVSFNQARALALPK